MKRRKGTEKKGEKTMSNYYEYEDLKRRIVHRLFKLDGWKVYGWTPDESDMMTDYWSPEHWRGIAEKNGYKLVVDHQYAAEERRYKTVVTIDSATAEKIKKLEQMTQERGASAAEEETAKAKIAFLKNKCEEEAKKTMETEIIEPGHMANPPRCNWHIEKDGVIIDKGTGLLKFSGVPDITREEELKDWQKFNNLPENEWKANFIKWLETHSYYYNGCDTPEDKAKLADRKYEEAKEKYALLEKFNQLINRINTTCGGMVGNTTDFYTYKEVVETEYKTEVKARETETGSLKEGQHIVIKSGRFNYGVCKGYVYIIHEYDNGHGGKYYKAVRLNGKLTKELTGTSNSANCLGFFTDDADVNRLLKWIKSGAVAWCDLEEVKTPYEVKKVIKVKAGQEEEPEEVKTETKTESQVEAEKEVAETVTTSENVSESASEKEEAKTEREITEKPAQEEAKTESKMAENAAENDTFSELARAYFQGKTIKKQAKKESKNVEKKEEKREEKQDENHKNKPDYTVTETLFDTEKVSVIHAINGLNVDTIRDLKQAEKELIIIAPVCYLAAEKMEQSKIHFLETGRDIPENEIKITSLDEYIRLANVRIKPGYTGNDNEKLSDEERAKLFRTGRAVKIYEIGRRTYKNLYYTIDYADGVKLLYGIGLDEDEKVELGANSKYIGFVIRDNMFWDTKPVVERLKNDIERRILELVPDFETASKMLDSAEENKGKSFDKNIYLGLARERFYNGEKPELRLYNGDPRGEKAVIEYLLNPDKTVDECARKYIKANKVDIFHEWERYTKTLEEYRKITSDTSREEHKILAISACVSDEKTVRILLTNGAEVKVEMWAVKHIKNSGNISYWYVAAQDRDKLECREIKVDEIEEIKHGSKTLYRAAA